MINSLHNFAVIATKMGINPVSNVKTLLYRDHKEINGAQTLLRLFLAGWFTLSFSTDKHY